MTRLGLRLALPFVVLLAACGEASHEYPPEVVKAFLASCQQRADASHCDCAIDKLQETYSYEQFQSMERRLNEREVQAEMANAVSDCR